ncbi:MAG TPA: histidine phosphatase family protein [Chloroflexota bacterium]|nr:histidine phosphatase family protein [Chloroflexota bacterium]
MTQLYFIRHGEATYSPDDNAAALTPLGVAQCERLRDRLAATREIRPDVVIASTMRRAAVTAEIVAPAFGLPIVYDDGVEEIRPGALRGVPGGTRGG